MAKKSLFLYRGADFNIDSPYCLDDKSKPYSLSYGSSLFAGCIFDGGATAFDYMRNEPNAYAISVPFDEVDNPPFYIPTTHPVAQLFGEGESFHSRTKGWEGFKKIAGINVGPGRGNLDHLKSDLKQIELIEKFQNYKSKAIYLK